MTRPASTSRTRITTTFSRCAVLLAGVALATGCAADDAPPLAEPAPARAGADRRDPMPPADVDAPTPGADPTARFLACLQAAGVDAAIHDPGYVVVRSTFADEVAASRLAGGDRTDPILADPRMALTLFFTADDAGNPAVAPASAAFFADEPHLYDAWSSCEAAHPGFEQGEPDPAADAQQAALRAEQLQWALDFAARARAAGHHWVPDPSTDSLTVVFPADVTEAQLRAALTEALIPDEWVGFEADGDPGFDWRAVLGSIPGAAQG